MARNEIKYQFADGATVTRYTDDEAAEIPVPAGAVRFEEDAVSPGGEVPVNTPPQMMVGLALAEAVAERRAKGEFAPIETPKPPRKRRKQRKSKVEEVVVADDSAEDMEG